MNDVDVSKIKVGDLATVRVVEADAADRTVRIDGGLFKNLWISAEAIVSHTPAPRPALKVGDRVRTPAGFEWGIAHIDAGYAHFAVRTDPLSRRVPETLTTVETWERV